MATPMTAVAAETQEHAPARAETLPLFAGDRLTRAEFERRYAAHPEIKKAELIEGVVYIPSPVKHGTHGKLHLYLGGWITQYVAATPGVEGSDNATVRLDNLNEVQPDILLRIDRALGGRSIVSLDDYVEGSPELVVEVSATSASYDMHDKKRVYARNGVQEYLAVLTYERALHWFVLEEGEYQELQPDADAILRSRVFPGLWLDAAALWQQDLARVLAVLQQGLATPEHTAFAARLRPTSG
jgi:Uma2 family endonuclease